MLPISHVSFFIVIVVVSLLGIVESMHLVRLKLCAERPALLGTDVVA